MNISLENFKVFYNVAKYKSFSETSKKIYISQPAITQRINILENQLNCKLFYRNASGVRLTEEGKKLFEDIKNSMETMEKVEENFYDYINNKVEEETIKIQTTNSNNNLYIYSKIIKLLASNENIKIKILENSNIKSGLEALSNEEIDLLIFDRPYNIRKNNIKIVLQDKLEQVLYTSKKYLENNKIDLYKNNNCNYILPTKGTLEREQLDKYFLKSKINIKSISEVDNYNIRNLFVSNNLGIAVGIKENIKQELKRGLFIEIPLKEKLPTYNIYIAKLENNKKINQFINIA